jgi:nitrogenase molybdenum-iron protein NifN
VLITDIQDPMSETASCPGTCGSPAECQGLDRCSEIRGSGREEAPVEKAPKVSLLASAAAHDDEDEPLSKNFTSTRNACKLCTPLGACLVFRGVEGCIPFLHGSQGCSTYIRRYLISHFREPIDIASSNFHEDSAIFGGGKNFTQGVLNINRQYQPQLIGAATTCLAETIGEDMGQLLHDFREKYGAAATVPIVYVSTASYRGTHMDGFHAAVRELVAQLAENANGVTPVSKPAGGGDFSGGIMQSGPAGLETQRQQDFNRHRFHQLWITNKLHPFPLTPALSPGERENHRQTHSNTVVPVVVDRQKAVALGLGFRGMATRPPVALFPGMVSAADLRYLKEIFADFGLPLTLLPDYSETMDGATWSDYEKLQSGGTPVAAIRALGGARTALEFGRVLAGTTTAGTVLHDKFAIPHRRLGLPIGIRESDAFFNTLAEIAGGDTPPRHQSERGRLVDSLIDGHKYAFEKRAVVFGEEDLVVGLTAFLCEIGVTPVLCASGGRSKQLEKCLRAAAPELPAETLVKEGFDFAEIAETAPGLKPDFLIGSSKGYSIARKLNVPLIRVGFPIHDRIGGQRVLHLGYRGAQELYDRIINALLDVKQGNSNVGYSYL